MGIVDKVGKFILNRGFGVMTSRQKTASALRVGRALFDASEKGQPFTPEIITSIFSSKLPKGVKLPPVLTSEGSFKEHILSQPFFKFLKLIKNDAYKKAEKLLTGQIASAGAAYKTTLGGKSCFYFPQKYLTTPEASVVGMTHEFMHFLDLGRFPMPIKTLFVSKFHSSYMDLQLKCLSDLGLQAGLTGHVPENFMKTITSSNKKIKSYFRKVLRQEMENIPRPLRRLFLGFLERMNTSEVLAYTNSGRAARRFGILGKDRVHTSELIGKYQELFLAAIKAEQKVMKYSKKAGVKIPKVPKRKFRTVEDWVKDKNGNSHRKTVRYSTTYRENPLPKCVKNIRKNMQSQGENLYKIPTWSNNIISEEVVRLDDVHAAGGKAARKVLHINGSGLKS